MKVQKDLISVKALKIKVIIGTISFLINLLKSVVLNERASISTECSNIMISVLSCSAELNSDKYLHLNIYFNEFNCLDSKKNWADDNSKKYRYSQVPFSLR